VSDFLLKDGQTFVFAGDSITDCGRRGDHRPYGQGYVAQAMALIAARYPARNIHFINAGISGNSAPNLRDRWQDDVLFFKPDWVAIKIGINDVHRALEGRTDTTPDIYHAAYRGILERTCAAGAKPILIDPFYISTESDTASARQRVLDLLPEYLGIVERLAQDFDARHVRTHELFQEQLKTRPAEYFCPEPVHPYMTGHLIIAHGLLKVLNW
jgi:lysophospholipase L1-like esterase